MHSSHFTMGDTLSVRAWMSRGFMRMAVGNLGEEALDRQWRPVDLCGIMSICIELDRPV